MMSFKPRLLLAAATVVLSVFSANAASVKDCGDDFKANVQNLAEPWEKNTKTFLNGAVRIALIDTGGEPVCCSMHLLILAEAPEDPSGPPSRMCKIVSHTDMGFMMIDFPKIRSGFSPARGLDLMVPFALYIDGLKSRPGVARINVNTRTGVVTAR
jgi:hypothetical protein